MIPLTLRAMIRTPHPDVRSLGRLSLALVSVLVLLASACFPVLAQAETVYKTESTTLPPSGGGNPPTHKNNPVTPESSPGAKQSTAPGHGGGEGGGKGQSRAESLKSQNGESKGSNPSSPGGGGKTQGKSGKEAVDGGKSPNSVQIGEPKSAVSDSGGSSPLVPILIAVAVLAAISVGAVLVRQRRGSAGGVSLKRG
jgi:cobalamin biosynthesis Mg chelatase CobN